jgi:YggT family protein
MMAFLKLAFLKLIDRVILLYIWVLIIHIVLSWLIYFGVVNSNNPLIRTLQDFAHRITEPALAWLRRQQTRLIPKLNFDLSPIVLILLLQFALNLMWELTYGTA